VEEVGCELSSTAVFRSLQRYSYVQSIGLKLFSGTRRERLLLWREFGNFVRQAQLYAIAAERVSDSSSALLKYYSCLNLAKAELLVVNPSSIMNKLIRHGLSLNPLSAKSLAADKISVQSGVFKELYKGRTGQELREKDLSIKRLLGCVPEVGWEHQTVFGQPPSARMVGQAIAWDHESKWFVWAIANATDILTYPHFTRFFHEVEPDSNFPEIFSLSRRATGTFRFFESKLVKEPGPAGRTDLPDPMARHFRGRLNLTHGTAFDAVYTPSLLKSRSVAITSDLARYAIIFYVSSLARYKPSRLEADGASFDPWMLDAFVDQSWLYLLASFLSGIEGRPVRFVPEGAMRS
jgi:YaaC-like Protein